jgi:hypothetical protein
MAQCACSMCNESPARQFAEPTPVSNLLTSGASAKAEIQEAAVTRLKVQAMTTVSLTPAQRRIQAIIEAVGFGIIRGLVILE